MSEKLFNFENMNKLEPKKGRILLAEPFIEDSYFKRSVILLCEHNDEGSFGFVLNNFVDIELNELVEGLETIESRISLGGPVQTDNLFFLHKFEDLEGATEVTDGLYVGGKFEHLQEYTRLGVVKEGTIRFFLGYAGWSPDQLEDELEISNSWFVTDVDAIGDVMAIDHDHLWQDTLKSMGGRFSLISNFPENPTLN